MKAYTGAGVCASSGRCYLRFVLELAMKVTIVGLLGHGARDEHQLIMDKINAFCQQYKRINEAAASKWAGNAFDRAVQGIFE